MDRSLVNVPSINDRVGRTDDYGHISTKQHIAYCSDLYRRQSQGVASVALQTIPSRKALQLSASHPLRRALFPGSVGPGFTIQSRASAAKEK